MSVDPASARRLKGETSVEEPTRSQRAIARRIAEVRATVPDLEFGADVDAGAALALATARDCPLTAVLVRSCALALRHHPRANAAYRDGSYELYSRVNVALNVEVGETVFAPTILDADTKSLEQLASELHGLIAQARAGELTPPQLSGATFTLTEHEVARAGALITPPQAAGLAAGCVREVPVVGQGGAVTAGRALSLSLACDGRILFGAQAASFLARIVQLLETAEL